MNIQNENDKITKEETSETSIKYLIWLLLAIILLWLISLFSLYNNKDRGTFGDMFGGINALFSGFAFAGLIYAIFLQKNELSLQRKELKYTREELKGQKEQLKLQNSTLEKQNFESTFFQLLNLHNIIVNSIYYKSKLLLGNEEKSSGRDCFVVFYDTYQKYYKNLDRTTKPLSEKEIISESYKKFYSDNQKYIGHYFLYLYNIAKFINSSSVKNKRFYSNLLRSQLSYNELALLFYNCLSVPEENKFKPIIEDFTLFKNLPTELLINKNHIDFYKEGAFNKPK